MNLTIVTSWTFWPPICHRKSILFCCCEILFFLSPENTWSTGILKYIYVDRELVYLFIATFYFLCTIKVWYVQSFFVVVVYYFENSIKYKVVVVGISSKISYFACMSAFPPFLFVVGITLMFYLLVESQRWNSESFLICLFVFFSNLVNQNGTPRAQCSRYLQAVYWNVNCLALWL